MMGLRNFCSSHGRRHVQPLFLKSLSGHSIQGLSFIGGKRSLITESIEPPLNSTVPEKPCTVVLAENQFYSHHSPQSNQSDPSENSSSPSSRTTTWVQRFRHDLPMERGIHYCRFQLESSLSSPSSSLGVSLESALKEMEQDIIPIPNTILIARGPLYSWIAPYYLESLPLAGLVLVDPLFVVDSNKNEIDKRNNWIETACHPLLDGHDDSTLEFRIGLNEYNMMKRILDGNEKQRPLKLEAGSVPMLILYNSTNSLASSCNTNNQDLELFHKSAQSIANRHSFHPGDVPVKCLNENEVQQQSEEEAIDIICDWIDEYVL